MLPAPHRLRRPGDFSRVVRSGARAGRSTVVVHVAASSSDMPTRVGFVVSKAVGNSVIRNRVERRLRAASSVLVAAEPVGWDVVVRALPSARDVSFATLSEDLGGAWTAAHRRLAGRRAPAAATPSSEPAGHRLVDANREPTPDRGGAA